MNPGCWSSSSWGAVVHLHNMSNNNFSVPGQKHANQRERCAALWGIDWRIKSVWRFFFFFFFSFSKEPMDENQDVDVVGTANSR